MGSWGPGLYQDDEALDLKGSIALLSRMPADGERILEILLADYPSSVELTADGGPTFWLVVADQFERKGIRCASVFDRAIDAIENGHDIRDLRAREMNEKDLRKRQRVLDELRQRFVNPRPARTAPSSRLPPPVVLPGEVYTFPTMNGAGINPWSPAKALYPLNCDPNSNRWEQRGWGAFLILQTGRSFDWFPWCYYVRLSVPTDREASLGDAQSARALFQKFISVGVPRSGHLKRMAARRLGQLSLDPTKVAEVIAGLSKEARHDPDYAVRCGWSIETRAYNGSVEACPRVTEFLV
jgi:hypothetical protein